MVHLALGVQLQKETQLPERVNFLLYSMCGVIDFVFSKCVQFGEICSLQQNIKRQYV